MVNTVDFWLICTFCENIILFNLSEEPETINNRVMRDLMNILRIETDLDLSNETFWCFVSNNTKGD